MDGDEKKYLDAGSYSGSDGVHETSFNTASEGRGSDPSDYVEDGEPIRSSRSMPVPEHLQHRAPLAEEETEAPPPSYDEAVSGSSVTPRPVEEDNESLTPDEIDVIMRSREDINTVVPQDYTPASGEEDISHDEKDMYNGRQKDRNSYLPSADRRNSFEEAMHMLPAAEQSADPPETARRPPEIEPMEMEEGRQREEYTCSGWGPLDDPMTRFCRFVRRQSLNRLILFSVLIIAIIGLLLFVSLFPASFVYVNYHQVALAQSKMTNVVDRDMVYYPGCYVLGPDTKLIFFTGSVHNIINEMSVFTLDTIGVTIRYSVHYFIRPSEVGKLFSMFMFEYDDVFQKIIRSSMRNLAGTSLTVDNFRFNRTYVETQMHSMLRKRLGGDCCPECCKERMCQSNTYCATCKTTNCDQGYHVDVRFFHLLSVSISKEVSERLLYRTILEIKKEKEFFLQDHAVTTKNTEMLTSDVRNQANEIIQAGNFEANKIAVIAEAEKEKVVQNSYISALKGLFSTLNVTQEDHQLSLMLVRAMEDSVDNLYSGYGFEKNTLYNP